MNDLPIKYKWSGNFKGQQAMQNNTDYNEQANEIIAKIVQHTGVKMDKTDPFVVCFVEQKKLFHDALERELKQREEIVKQEQDCFLDRLKATEETLNNEAKILEKRKDIIIAELLANNKKIAFEVFEKYFKAVIFMFCLSLLINIIVLINVFS